MNPVHLRVRARTLSTDRRMVGSADGYVALHLRKSRVGQDDAGARTGGASRCGLVRRGRMADAPRCGDQQSRRPCASFQAAESRLGSPCDPAASVGRADRVRFRRQHAERPCLGSIDIRKRQCRHVLHYIVASDESCKARLRLRNETKPEGLYFGFVSEDRFDEVTRYFTPPSDQENFHVVYYEAETPSSKG